VLAYHTSLNHLVHLKSRHVLTIALQPTTSPLKNIQIKK